MTAPHVFEFDANFRYPHGFSLDFKFAAGPGITALIGPSGAGKTTILNLTAGLLRPHSGHIVLAGQSLFDSRTNVDLPPERRGIGYVFQDYQLFPHLTVLENLRYGAQRQASQRSALDKVATTLELAALLQRYPAALSGGQKQRVAIGRALLCDPRLLLLDEPLNAVHWELRETVLDYLRRVVDEFHLPTLLVSHDHESIAQFVNATIEL